MKDREFKLMNKQRKTHKECPYCFKPTKQSCEYDLRCFVKHCVCVKGNEERKKK